MLRKVALLSLAGIVSATSFSGTGQLRTLASSNSGNGTDLGCLTDGGDWTTDDALCGTFTGTRTSGSVIATITSLEGPCTIANTNFTCSADATALKFWAWSGLLEDYDVLAYGEQITYSSTAGASNSSDSIPIRTYRTTDPKPWVWLGWSSQ